MKTCCNTDCQQGKTCPLRQKNGGEAVDTGLPVVMFEPTHQYIQDLFFSAINWLGLAFLVVALAGCVGFVVVRFFSY